MQKSELTALLAKMDELAGAPTALGPLSLRMLRDDVRTHYLNEYQDLGNRYRSAWDESVWRRLQGMTLPAAVAAGTTFSALKGGWRAAMKTTGLRIHFGQMRVGPDFQGSATTGQAAVTGFPDQHVIGRPISVVAGSLTNGTIQPDQIPIQIFFSDEHECWVAANNRGYTAYCRSGVQPLRLWPRLPSQDELNRLKEIENTYSGSTRIGPFTYMAGVAARLAANPRTLPALDMPITGGPNSWEVHDVVTVPATFN